MSNNPFSSWTLDQVNAHNARVAASRMRGNPTSELFERALREKSQQESAALIKRQKVCLDGTVVSSNGRRKCTIGGREFSFRSLWEQQYAAYLQLLKDRKEIIDFEYECQIFWFEGIRRGKTNYTPDFKVIYYGGRHEWREVKGWMSPGDKTKLKRMLKFFPEEVIKVIDGDWFKAHGKTLAGIVPGWSKKK